MDDFREIDEISPKKMSNSENMDLLHHFKAPDLDISSILFILGNT